MLQIERRLPQHTAVLLAGYFALFGQSAAQERVSRVELERGWSTFGLAVPQGAAPESLRIDSLPTQTDVKARWPDGSIRFAVLTAQASRGGRLDIFAAPNTDATPFDQGRWPQAQVLFNLDGARWSAGLPVISTEDIWLSGPLVREARAIVVPLANNRPHPFLRVIFDVRDYSTGGWRLDVTVENTLDVTQATMARYDVEVRSGSRVLFEKKGVEHRYLTRWRRVFDLDAVVSAAEPDLASFIEARAVPSYDSDVSSPERALEDGKYDILQVGDLHVPMNDVGGRPEIAPFPDWTAQYLVHRRPDQRSYMLRHGELAGSWGIHLREPDGERLVTIDAHPDYWLDTRSERAENRPKGDLTKTGHGADLAHQPSLAFVPYLITGDRFFADEVAFWANYSLLKTYQDSGYYNSRGGGPGRYTPTAGAQGLLFDHEPRAFGWGLRNIADAAAYLPESSPYREYFAEKVYNNLAWLDAYAERTTNPLGILFPDGRPENQSRKPGVWIALWEQEYLAWAIDRANGHGFAGATNVRNRVADLQVRLLTSGRSGYDPAYGAPYLLVVGQRTGSGTHFFTSPQEMFTATFGTSPRPPESMIGTYGPEAWLAVLIALEQQQPGAQAALEYLRGYRDESGTSITEDRRRRSGWAIERPSAAGASRTARPRQP